MTNLTEIELLQAIYDGIDWVVFMLVVIWVTMLWRKNGHR